MAKKKLLPPPKLTKEQLAHGDYEVLSLQNVLAYFYFRELKMPDTEYEALGFLVTELGEVYEQLLAKTEGWVRNNPQNKEEHSTVLFAEELGDVIMMALIAGYVGGADPIAALHLKMARKMKEQGETA